MALGMVNTVIDVLGAVRMMMCCFSLARLCVPFGAVTASWWMWHVCGEICDVGVGFDQCLALSVFIAVCIAIYACVLFVICSTVVMVSWLAIKFHRMFRDYRLETAIFNSSASAYACRCATRARGPNDGLLVRFLRTFIVIGVVLLFLSAMPMAVSHEEHSIDHNNPPTGTMFECKDFDVLSASTYNVWVGSPICTETVIRTRVSEVVTAESCWCVQGPILCLYGPHRSALKFTHGFNVWFPVPNADSPNIIVFAGRINIAELYAKAVNAFYCGVRRVATACVEVVDARGHMSARYSLIVIYSPWLGVSATAACILDGYVDSYVDRISTCGDDYSRNGVDVAWEFSACGTFDDVHCTCVAEVFPNSDGLVSAVLYQVVPRGVVMLRDETNLFELDSETVFALGCTSNVNGVTYGYCCPIVTVENWLRYDVCLFDKCRGCRNSIVCDDGVDQCRYWVHDQSVMNITDVLTYSTCLNDSYEVSDYDGVVDDRLDVHVSNDVDFDVARVIAVRFTEFVFKVKSLFVPMMTYIRETFNTYGSWVHMYVGWSFPLKLVHVGYWWEILAVGLSGSSKCLRFTGVDIDCVYHVIVSVKIGYYFSNVLCILASIVSSVAVASLTVMFIWSAPNVRVPGSRDVSNRALYTFCLVGAVSLVLSGIGVRPIDVMIILVVAVGSGVPYGIGVEDKFDNCMLSAFAFPRSMLHACWFTSVHLVAILSRCIRQQRILVLGGIVGSVGIFGWFGPSAFLHIGSALRVPGSPVPVLWILLAVLSSACMSAFRAVFRIKLPIIYVVTMGFHVSIARWYVLIWTAFMSSICFVLCSRDLWDHGNVESIPQILFHAGVASKLVTLKLLPIDVCWKFVGAWMVMHVSYVMLSELNAMVYRTLMFGYTHKNVTLVYKRYSGWRLAVARLFMPDRRFRNVYWLTATTGAGKTTVDVYSRFYIDETLHSGVGFNVIDVDACVRNVAAPTAKNFADSRLSATGHGGMNEFFGIWIPVARKFIHEQLHEIFHDSKRSLLPSLVMVHVPREGELLGLPLCNFLGHIHVNDEEAMIVSGARARDVNPDVTLAFIKSDEMMNTGVVRVDWPDVQGYLAPVKAITDLPLAIFPDLDVASVFVRVDTFTQRNGLDGRCQISSSLNGVPLVAVVGDTTFTYRWGLAFVRADVFGDIKSTILDASRDRLYYDDIPLKKDGRVNWQLLGEERLSCVVYRMELPSRHGRRGIAPSVRLRIDLMSAGSRDEAEAYVQRRFMSGSLQSGSIPRVSSGVVGGSSRSAAPVDDVGKIQGSVGDVDQVISRELKAIGAVGVVPTPPLGQYQTPAQTDIVTIQGKEWPDDGSIVYKNKDLMPPVVPPRLSAVSPCPLETCKVIEYDAADMPWGPMEALRRYIPVDMAYNVQRIIKHGDAASRARNVRALKGWAIEFDTEENKRKFFQRLPAGVFAVEIVANPFNEKTWGGTVLKENTLALAKFKEQMCAPENF